MKKIGLIFILIVGIFLASFHISLAKASLATPAPKEVTSFELFWPIVAGRTIEDPLYILKTLKENVRGFFIFGKAEKADYHVFLSTKRIIEAEKLINEGKKEAAIKTLGKTIVLLETAKTEVSNASVESISSDIKDNINKQLGNLEIFVPSVISKLKSQDDDLAVKLKEVLSLVNTFNSKI